MSAWNGTESTCRKCRGTGLYLVDVENPAVLEPRECLYCGGAGKVEKAPPPTAEEKAVARKGELAALCEPRAAESAEVEPVPRESAEEFRRKSAAWWARDRAARIRAGACGVCGERLCPRVGGSDAVCVPGEAAAP